MMNAQALKAEIARAGMTQKQVAQSIGISANTFSQKLKKGTFGINEANEIVELLNIADPGAIFFASR